MKIFSTTLFLSIVLIFNGCAPAFVSEDTQVQRVVELNVENLSMSKDQIFVKTMEWFSQTFNESKSVIDYQDKESGTIIGNGAVTHFYGMIVNGQVRFSVKVQAKDNRARVTLSNFTSYIIGTPGSGPPASGALQQKDFDKALPNLEALIDDYENFLTKGLSSNNDEW